VKKLAIGLGISVPQLFTPPMGDQINGRLAVIKSGEGQPLATVTYEHELLADSLTQKTDTAVSGADTVPVNDRI
jgi:hypothetical protein